MIVWSRIIEVSPDYGALVVKRTSFDRGDTVEAKELGDSGNYTGKVFYATVVEYGEPGTPTFAAVFPALAPGNYQVSKPYKTVSVFPGHVAIVE